MNAVDFPGLISKANGGGGGGYVTEAENWQLECGRAM